MQNPSDNRPPLEDYDKIFLVKIPKPKSKFQNALDRLSFLIIVLIMIVGQGAVLIYLNFEKKYCRKKKSVVGVAQLAERPFVKRNASVRVRSSTLFNFSPL